VIGSLRGRLSARLSANEVLVEVGGVGYRLTVTTPTAAALGALGDEVQLSVHTHVREDAIVLFGFAHDDERRCFEAVLGARGVGPTLAVALLSALSPAALSVAVLEDDVDTLCVVPGVGRKTAQRLLLDLKARLELPDLAGPVPGGASASTTAEVRAALAELGYSPEEIRLALQGTDGEGRVEDLLRQALKELAGR
jgi:Holliday junction DNA helicase RuvA